MTVEGSGIVGIVLAAGAGSRFGSDKLLHRLSDGTPMAVAAATTLHAACSRIIAVVRPEADELVTLLAEAQCTVLRCNQAHAGMGYSLAAGVRASADATGWVVALADMPFIKRATHELIAAQLVAGATLVLPEFQGRRGHPVGFSHKWLRQLSALTGDQGGRMLLAQHPEEIVLCPVDDAGVIWDIDRLEDLEGIPVLK